MMSLSRQRLRHFDGFISATQSTVLNVFMEKPVSVDGPTTRRMIALGEEAGRKNLKVGVGLMVRHCRARQELLSRIRDGQIGDIVAMRGYRMGSGGGTAPVKPEGITELMHQIRLFHSFLWASGGVFSDYYIHQIDELSWMKGAWPVEAMAIGGRHYRGNSVDQNFDVYSVQYTYLDGTRLFFDGRSNMPGVQSSLAAIYAGRSASAEPNATRTMPGHAHLQGSEHPALAGRAEGTTARRRTWYGRIRNQSAHPMMTGEWNDLMAAIRADKPYNEVKRRRKRAWWRRWAALPRTQANWSRSTR